MCVVLWIDSCRFKSHNDKIYNMAYLLDTRRVAYIIDCNLRAIVYESFRTSL